MSDSTPVITARIGCDCTGEGTLYDCVPGMRRRLPHSSNTERHGSGNLKRLQTRNDKHNTTRRVDSLPKHFVGHPLFGFFLFLALFPGWALVSHCRKLCAEGDFPGCAHNDPNPFLTRSLETFFPNWRPDGRCGSNFPAPSGHLSAVCNPFARDHCCSQWGYCGKGPEYCAQAVKPPFNLTGTGDATRSTFMSMHMCMHMQHHAQNVDVHAYARLPASQ